jgi:hypothetical protein
MWRRILARAHPDSGGDHELFVWIQNVREHCTQAHPVHDGMKRSK